MSNETTNSKNNGAFDFNAFINESKETLLNPKSYFAALKTTGGMSEPLIKAVIYGTVTGIFTFLWSVLKLGAVTGGLFGGSIGVMAFVSSIIGAIIGLFIGAVIVLIISAICGGSTDFESNVRVTASLMVLMPVNAALGFISGFSLHLNLIISAAVGLYGLWMLYNALCETLKAKQETAKIVCYVLAALSLLATINGLMALNKAKAVINMFNL
jgi:hypothetical protein